MCKVCGQLVGRDAFAPVRSGWGACPSCGRSVKPVEPQTPAGRAFAARATEIRQLWAANAARLARKAKNGPPSLFKEEG
jgi:hypothetical protein